LAAHFRYAAFPSFALRARMLTGAHHGRIDIDIPCPVSYTHLTLPTSDL